MSRAFRGVIHPTRPARRAPTLLALAAVIAAASAVLTATSDAARAHTGAVTITSRPFGITNQSNPTPGTPTRLFTLANGRMRVNITNFGGVIQSIDVPDRRGHLSDVSLGFRDLPGYEANDVFPQPSGGSGSTYFGATVGRYANRIAKGTFTLNGMTYHVPINNGQNALHGGPIGWNQRVWTPVVTRRPGTVSLTLTYVSPDGEQGFPGTVTASVTFSLGRTDALTIHYHATTDKPTVINLTNHSYFNLAGQASGSILAQRLMINSSRYTPTDANQIPTGAIAPVAGTPLDFRHFKAIGRDITAPFGQLLLAHGYDHNWILDGHGMRLAARAMDPVSGRTLTAYTTEPGVQVYTGNYLAGELVGSTGRTYRQSAGFTLETQHYPDSPNQPSFPSTTLNPGTPFDSTTVFSFGVAR
ncbi:MAG: galactose mutarotase [Actinomycetota bacterium]|nr:galactose mutarotase [Actinomycetota bacterium]